MARRKLKYSCRPKEIIRLARELRVKLHEIDQKLEHLIRNRLVVKGGKLKLKSLVSHPSTSPQKLNIVVIIAGEEKGSYAVAVVSASRISNFEGQLTMDARQIEVDDAEYQAILSRL